MKEIVKAHCNKCAGKRNHEVSHQEEFKEEDEVDTGIKIWEISIFEMIKCCGCENIELRHTFEFSENIDDEGRPIATISYYPPAIYRKLPRWFHKSIFIFGLKDDLIAGLLYEINVALQNDSKRLAAMGVRALIEHIMIDKIEDQGSFRKNVAKFHEKGFISMVQKKILLTILEAGHAAIHRSYNPSEEDLTTLIDVAESVIESIYVNE